MFVVEFFCLTQSSYNAFIQSQFSSFFSSFRDTVITLSKHSQEGKFLSYKLLIDFLAKEANGHKKNWNHTKSRIFLVPDVRMNKKTLNSI